MPVNKNIVRHIRVSGGQIERRVINVPNRFQQREATALTVTDYTKPVEPIGQRPGLASQAVAPVTQVVVKKTKTATTTHVAAPVTNTNNVTVSIPTGYPINKNTVVDSAESKAERAKVLKAINEALLGKPKKVGQRGGFLRSLQ